MADSWRHRDQNCHDEPQPVQYTLLQFLYKILPDYQGPNFQLSRAESGPYNQTQISRIQGVH